LGAPGPGQVGQPGGSDDRGPSDFAELGPASGLARQARPGGMGCPGRAAGSAASATFSCSSARPVVGYSGRFSRVGVRADLGRADGSGSRRSRRRSNVGIATAAARWGTPARLGGTGPAATGERARARLGCASSAGVTRRGPRAELGRTRTAGAPGRGSRAELGRPRATGFAGGRPSPWAYRTSVGRTAGACRAASDRCAATCLESTRGAILGPAQACEPDPRRTAVQRLGRAARRGPGPDRRPGVGCASARAAGMGASENRGAGRSGGTVLVRSIPRRGSATLDPPGGRSNGSLVIAGQGTCRTGGAARSRIH
jgi:hypothetical protein